MGLDHNKTKFDKEYQTQYMQEVKFLEQHGIRYVFVKEINGISTFKYTKTEQLFKLLSLFYIQK